MLEIGQEINVTAFDIDYQGYGVVSFDDTIIFVPHLLVLESAVIKITKIKKNHAMGEVVQLLTTSKDRVTSIYSQFGACDLIHMSHEKQLEFVTNITKKTLQKIASIDVKIHDVVHDNNTTHYRNKSVFHVLDEDTLTCFLYGDKDHKPIIVSSFILSSQEANHVIKSLTKNKISIEKNILKHIVIRSNPKGQILVTLVAVKSNFKGLDDIINILKNDINIIGITLNIKDKHYEILGSKSITLYGENLIVEPLGDIDIFLNDKSFFQVNHSMMIKTYDIIKSHILKNTSTIDAYSGVGSIGFYLKDVSHQITMIESNIDSCEMANKTKEKYHLDHIHIIHGKTEEKIKEFQADVLIVDPPRSGLYPSFVEHMIESKYQQIFYLSCDIKTLARDLKLLKDVYHITDIYPIRMFPNTTELETLVILKKSY